MRLFRAALVITGAALLAMLDQPVGRYPAIDSDAAPVDFDATPDAFTHASGALMHPGAHRAFLVTPAGDLTNGAWVVHLVLEADGKRAEPPRRIAAEHRWLPVLHWWRRANPIMWTCRATAVPPQRDADTSVVVSLLIEAVNTGRSTVHCRTALELDPLTAPPLFVAPDTDSSEVKDLAWASGNHSRAHGWTSAVASGRTAGWVRTLAPGERAVLRTILPAYARPSRWLTRIAMAPHAQHERLSREAWRHAVSRGLALELGDPEVEDAWRAALVVLLSCRERNPQGWMPIGNPFQYRDVWLRDAARLVTALAMAGFTSEARDAAAGLLEFQWPQGPFVSQRGQLDGTGQALWAFEQTLLRGKPAADLTRCAEAARRAVGWFEVQRVFARESGAALGGLLPFGYPGDNELTRAQLVGNDAWALAGYRAAERLLRAAGDTAAATGVARQRSRYHDDVRRALFRLSDLPPAWQKRGRDWGNLSAAYPCGMVPPTDPRVAMLASRLWRRSGRVGMCVYGDPDSLHGYLAADLGTAALLAGDHATAEAVLAGLLEWRNACGAGAELFSRSHRDFGANVPPHPTSSAALVTLVRNAIVFDDGDTLELTRGPRSAWWRDGRVSGAPTRWGVIDIRFRLEAERCTWQWTPVPVWTRLGLPRGTRVHGPLPKPLRAHPGGGAILAPPGTRTAVVTVEART